MERRFKSDRACSERPSFRPAIAAGPPSWAVEDQTYAVPPSSSRYADGLFRTAWLNVMEPTHHRHLGRTRRVLRQTPNRRGKTLAVSCALVKTLTRRALAPYRIFSGTEQVPGARPKCCRMASSVLVENLKGSPQFCPDAQVRGQSPRNVIAFTLFEVTRTLLMAEELSRTLERCCAVVPMGGWAGPHKITPSIPSRFF